MQEILNKTLPIFTFILGFLINWFVNRKEFYWKFYREKELLLLSEMNKDLRDVFINYQSPDGFTYGMFYSDIGTSNFDNKEINLFGKYPILVSSGLSKNFILKKYEDDPFIPDNIREIIKSITIHGDIENKSLDTKYLKVYDLNEIKSIDDFEKIDFYKYGDLYEKPYTYSDFYDKMRKLKFSINKILSRH